MANISKHIASTLPLPGDIDEFQKMNTEIYENMDELSDSLNTPIHSKYFLEFSDENNEILLNNDCLSTWIQNKQFVSQICNNKINELQNDIISTVFGDFNGLLSSLLKYYDDRCMTHLQQLKLNNILSKVHPTSIN
eukprot:98116_1